MPFLGSALLRSPPLPVLLLLLLPLEEPLLEEPPMPGSYGIELPLLLSLVVLGEVELPAVAGVLLLPPAPRLGTDGILSRALLSGKPGVGMGGGRMPPKLVQSW